MGDSSPVMDLYGMVEHSPDNISEYIVQSGNNVRIPYDFLPKDICVL